MNIIWNSWSDEISIVPVVGLPAHGRTGRRGSRSTWCRPSAAWPPARRSSRTPWSPRNEQGAGGASRAPWAAGSISHASTCSGIGLADPAVGTSSSRVQAGRTGRTVADHVVERAADSSSKACRVTPRASSPFGIAQLELDLDLLGRPVVAIVADVGPSAVAREDPRAVQVDQGRFDAELLHGAHKPIAST